MEERNLRKVMIGTVLSDKMDKTVVVAVKTSEKHKTYGKVQKRTESVICRQSAYDCAFLCDGCLHRDMLCLCG